MKSEFHIDYHPICNLYAKEQFTGTLYLAFRDLPFLLNTYLKNDNTKKIKALDFGCGPGASTRHLKVLENLFPNGFEVDGTDIDGEMLNLAREADPKGHYHLIENTQIPVADHQYDFIFSSFVLFEFATKEKMQKALEEVKRVMKKDSVFIAVTGSAESYNRHNQWVSLNVNFPQNDLLESGGLGRIDYMINEIPITFENYYWTEDDYVDVFLKAGFQIEFIHHPLGYKEEESHLSWHWKSELKVSPYYIFILK